ncbi:iron-siderophore ABC transporter substrate-binding protein [Okibacterium endophyticum]
MLRFRRSVATAVLAAAALIATGCSATTAPGDRSAQSSSPGFPVSIEHVYGTTEIPSNPERVITIGWMTQDIVAALGTVPIGTPTSWGGDEEGFTPWFRTQVEDVLEADMPTILNEGEEPDFEQILALEPDVILAPHSGITETQYARLSEIAPTVAYAERPWVSGDWQDLTRVVATALGENEKAEELIAQTEQAMQEALVTHPGVKDTSLLYGVSLSEGSAELGLYISADPRVAFLREFGLVDSPSLSDALGDVDDDDFHGAVSLEKLNTIDADVFIAWSSSPEETQYTLDHPALSRWEPIADGRYYIIEDATMGMATNGPTLLSIPWAIEEGFVDDVATAIDGGAIVRGQD